jgi:excisionase family DNA binding protein
MDDRWLSVDEVSEYLGVSKDTVYTWISARRMPAHRVGRLWKFKRDEVDGWVKSGGAADRHGIEPERNERSMTAGQLQSKSKGADAAVVPGLTPSAPYSSRLSARSALFPELHQLLDGESDALSSAEYRRRVVEENRLAKPSKAAREKLWKELKVRYRLDAEDPLFAAFWTEWQRCTSEPERNLTAYVFFALNDRLVTDLGVELLYPLLRRAPADVRLADVLAFIERAYRSHPEARAWSKETRVAVAQKYTASIRDFGLARGTIRKTSIRPALYGAPVRFIVRALRLAGVAPLDIVQAPAFKLLCLDTTEVIDALGEMNRIGALRFRMQGDVVELDVKAA